jgi:guanylate kinase
LTPGASIFLGKPTHNAFQERVFSRGTYADSNLKKSMKENNFEMVVLSSLNCHKMDAIIKQQLMKVKKRNYNAHLTAFFNKKKNYSIENVVEESDVICNNQLGDISLTSK